MWIDRPLPLAVALGGIIGLSATRADQVNQVLPVIAAFSDEDGGSGKAAQQSGRGGLVGRLPRREREANRQALLVDNGMDLAGQSSTRTANGVIRAPFLPPAACWKARTIELSINCIH